LEVLKRLLRGLIRFCFNFILNPFDPFFQKRERARERERARAREIEKERERERGREREREKERERERERERECHFPETSTMARHCQAFI